MRTHTGEKPFACMKCGRSFGDRSNRLSHQKKCTATKAILARPGTDSPNGGQRQQATRMADSRPVRALPERLASMPGNMQVIPNNNNARYVTPDKIRRRRQALTSEVYNDNAEEDAEATEAADVGGPQIVSVESVRAGGGEEGDEEDEEGMEGEEIVVDPTTLTDLDYDDIIDDSVYDEDLEEIQACSITLSARRVRIYKCNVSFTDRAGHYRLRRGRSRFLDGGGPDAGQRCSCLHHRRSHRPEPGRVHVQPLLRQVRPPVGLPFAPRLRPPEQRALREKQQ